MAIDNQQKTDAWLRLLRESGKRQTEPERHRNRDRGQEVERQQQREITREISR